MSKPTLMIKGKLYSDDPEVMKELAEWVPYEYILNWFQVRKSKTGIKNRVLILKSETASGKSTLLPPVIFERFVYNKHTPGIICTQPRVLTAIENVNQMTAHYKFLRLGDTVGWSTQNNKIRPSKYSLLSATIGTLTQQLKQMTDDEICRRYSFILIDETHERDHQTDLTIMLLKQFLLRVASREDCPFAILMSATFDPQPFLDYFNLSIDNFIWCKGEAAGFDKMWDWNESRITNNYPKSTAMIVDKICRQRAEESNRADILIFLPGKPEIKLVQKELATVNKKLAQDSPKDVFALLTIDGEAVKKNNFDKRMMTVDVADQRVKIGTATLTPYRRVIMSTAVAETGLTLDNLKYVIDAGFSRDVEFNPVIGARGLITKPAPKSRVTQRMGRAGRKFRGVFYPLYPEYIYNMLPEQQHPQILIADVTPILLDILKQQTTVPPIDQITSDTRLYFDLNRVDMIQLPPPDSLWYSMEQLYSMGMIGVEGGVEDNHPTVGGMIGIEDPMERSGSSVEDNHPTVGGMIGVEGSVVGRIEGGMVGSMEHNTKFYITAIGALASIITSPDIDTYAAKLILSGFTWRASTYDLCSIAAALAVGSQGMIVDKKLGIDWATIYSTLKIPDARVVCKSDFIDYLVLFYAMRDNALNLRKYSESVNITYDWCVRMLKTRDNIIDALLVNEFNMLTVNTLSDSTIETFMDCILRIKHCIYDTYRTNITTEDGEYYVYAHKEMRYQTKSDIYEVNFHIKDMISGYISLDEEFLG